MKLNGWTIGLIGVGLISAPTALRADEKPSGVLTALSSTTLSGYVDTSAQWNMGTGDANVPGYAFGGPGKADGFNLNVVKLSLEKPVDAADAWGAGYKVDMIAGPDANALATQSLGVKGDFGLKQAYVAVRAPVGNGLDVKLGVWDTIIGYEVFESINNPNVTRSYGYTMEPTTHTGLQLAYQFCDFFAATAGIANTYGSTINGRPFLGGATVAAVEGPKAESYKAYMGSMLFTAPTNWAFLGGSTLSACVINGFNTATAGTGTAADQTSYYIGATLATPVTGLKFGACYDYANVPQQTLTLHKSAYASAIGVYASFQATEKLSLYARGEYANASTAATFGTKDVFETTATLQYDLWKNVLSRIEFRWDHAEHGNAYGGTVAGLPQLNNSFILLASLAYKF